MWLSWGNATIQVLMFISGWTCSWENVWCMQGEDAKHPNRSRNKLFRIGTHSAWRTFKRHTVFLEDSELRDRLTRLIESTSALSDPFANDVMYHQACWLKYTRVYAKFKAEDILHLQGARRSDARNLVFKHVDSVIFNEHESLTAVSSSRLQTYCQWVWLSSGGCEIHISQRPAHLRV